MIEDTLFDKRRVLSAMFMDTTSLSFYGEGGETLGEHGYSKDYQPDLKQMILALIVDGAGRPISTEMWSGNTADVAMLLPVIDRLRRRFSIGRVCVVADRGMISAATIEGLEARKLEYILGARANFPTIGRKIVLGNNDPFVPLLIKRKAGETQLFVKQVTIEGKRDIVCRNEAEVEKDHKDREAIIAALDAQLKKGDKALIGNSAYRRYLRKSAETKDKRAFQIDAGKPRTRSSTESSCWERPGCETPASPPAQTQRVELYNSVNWPGFPPPRWPAFTPPLTFYRPILQEGRRGNYR